MQLEARVHDDDVLVLEALHDLARRRNSLFYFVAAVLMFATELSEEFVFAYSLPRVSFDLLEPLGDVVPGCKTPIVIIDNYQESSLHFRELDTALIRDKGAVIMQMSNIADSFRRGRLPRLRHHSPLLQGEESRTARSSVPPRPDTISALTFERRVLQNSADSFVFVYAPGRNRISLRDHLSHLQVKCRMWSLHGFAAGKMR
jgi:hypothetical protein